MAMLRLVPATGMPVEVAQDSVLVGRDPTCEVVLTDGSVSRKHARIERRGEGWYVVDQGSANGTFVDGERVTEAELLDGQDLRFGAVGFRVEADGAYAGATVMTRVDPVTSVQPGPTVATPAAPASPSARVAPPSLPGRATGLPVAPGEPLPVGPRSKRGPWLWIGGGCCGCFIVGLLVVAGVIGFSWKKTTAASGVAEQLVADTKNGNQAAAYARLSRSYQELFPADQFAAWLETHPALARNASMSRVGFESGTSGTRVTLLLTATSGEQERVTFSLVTEDGQLKISAIHFEESSTNP